MSNEIIYLASPYTHADPLIRMHRFKLVTLAAAALVAQGRIVFSPITMTHPIDLVLANKGETLGSAYWVDFDEAFMNFCSEMKILTLDGWEQSSGIARERRFFERQGKPVRFVSLEDLDIRASGVGVLLGTNVRAIVE